MRISRNLVILILGQALGMAGVSGVLLVGGIIGADLAPAESLATLPSAIMVVGTALSILPAGALMRRFGRRLGFLAGAFAAGLASLLAAYALARGSFYLFCLAVSLMGINTAFSAQYRFAAAENAPLESAGRAVSFVLLGGIVAGFLGTEIARRSKDLLPAGEFTGSFVALAFLYLLVFLVMIFFRDTPNEETRLVGTERPLRDIITQPLFLAALFSAAVAYGVMTLTMTATPVYMVYMHGFDLADTAWIIQSHILAMFLPSLISGWLVERLGVLRVTLAGLFCFLASLALALISVELIHFWGALVLLGMGWNFLFVGATVLLTRTYLPQERFKAQAANDFVVLGIQALASLSAGGILFAASWGILNLINLPFLALNLALLLALRQRIAVQQSELAPG